MKLKEIKKGTYFTFKGKTYQKWLYSKRYKKWIVINQRTELIEMLDPNTIIE